MNIEKISVKEIKEYLKKDDLTKYGTMMFMATIFSGGLNYIYQVYMGRALGPEEYGTFGALFGIFYMIQIIALTLMTSATQFTAKFVGEGKNIGFFIKRTLKQMIIIGSVVSIIFLFLVDWLRVLFKLPDSGPIIVLIVILFLTWTTPIIQGILRGAKQFSALCWSNMSDAIFKLIFGVILVTIGFGVSGALFGVVAGMLFSILIGYIFLKPHIKPNNPHDPEFNFRSFYLCSIPVMIAMFGYSVPTNLDVILAKYFFSPADAGLYTSVSVLGKIIFFLSVAICSVMFPMITEKYTKNESGIGILKKSIVYIGTISGLVALIYALYPELIVKVFGIKYIGAVDLMAPYGIAMFFFSITITIMYYHLAIKNMRYIVIFIGFTLLEISLFLIFHSSILEMVQILLIVNLILVVVSILYTWRLYEV